MFMLANAATRHRQRLRENAVFSGSQARSRSSLQGASLALPASVLVDIHGGNHYSDRSLSEESRSRNCQNKFALSVLLLSPIILALFLYYSNAIKAQTCATIIFIGTLFMLAIVLKIAR